MESGRVLFKVLGVRPSGEFFYFFDAWCYISRFLYSVSWPRKCSDSGGMTVISDNYVFTMTSAEKLYSPAISRFLIADYVS